MQSLQQDNLNPKNNAINIGSRTLVFFHTTLTLESLKRQQIIDFPNAVNAFTNAIPGLYIFDDFVNELEESQIIKGLDEA